MAPNMCTILSKYDGKISYKNNGKIGQKKCCEKSQKCVFVWDWGKPKPG